MAKRSRTWNESVYRRYLRERRGVGSGKEYTPWIMIQDFPSTGMVSRVKGVTTGRIHHFMSNNELYLFYLLDWSDNVLDIREQFPLLDLEQAINIAEKAQIRYPYDNKSGFPYVLTSDFLIETENGFTAISVKEANELKKLRIREKLEIERRYWKERNVKWQIITEKEINTIKAKNIEWLSQAKELDCFGFSDELQSACTKYFMARFSGQQSSIGDLICEVERHFNLSAGMGLNIYKHLAYWKQINVDAGKIINYSDFGRRNAILAAV